MKPGIRVKMEIKQLTLLLIIFFSFVLLSSSTKILHPEEKLQEISIGERKQYKGEHVSAIGHSSGHGGGSGGSGGSTGGGRGTSGGVSQGDTGSDTRNPSGASNMNHHRRGDSIRVQSSVLFTWVVAIFATQFCTQVM